MEQEKLKSVQSDGDGRYYQSPTTAEWYPSVTTVVNHEMADHWKEWRKNPANLAISKKALSRGTRMHTVLENFLKEGAVPPDPFDRLKFDLLRPFIGKIGKIHAIETAMHSDQILMAGRVDVIGDYDGEVAIIDFKTSGKEKTKEQIQNYFNQTTAYAHMWNESHTGSEAVTKIVILIVTDEDTVQEFVENPADHKESLFAVIRSYWNKNSRRSIQETANAIFQQTV